MKNGSEFSFLEALIKEKDRVSDQVHINSISNSVQVCIKPTPELIILTMVEVVVVGWWGLYPYCVCNQLIHH